RTNQADAGAGRRRPTTTVMTAALCGPTSRCAPATLDQATRPQIAYFHRYSAGARCVPPTAVAEYLARENVCRRQNAVARQRFCPLQGFEFVDFFRGVRGRSGIPAQKRLTNARAGFFLAAARTKPLLPRSPCDLTAAARAGYCWRIMPKSLHRRPT